MTQNTSSIQTVNQLLKESLIKSNSKEFTNFFNFLSRFSRYSSYNSMLVYIQNKEVAYYGSTGFWKKRFHRTVSPNARPYIILMPFGPVSIVYDIIDTEGEKTVQELLDIGLPIKPFAVDGILSIEQYKNFVEQIKAWNIPIHSKPLSYFFAGFITTKEGGKLGITINNQRNIEEKFAILSHELAHLFLGHTGHKYITNKSKEKEIQIKLEIRRNLSISIKELEAETVAFLLSKKIGLHTHSAEYIAGYINDRTDIINFNYELVIKTADKIERLFLKTKPTLE